MSRARTSIYLSLLCIMAGCAPLPITYYMPSADHATIEQYRCDQAPPYKAVFVAGILKTSAFFDGRQIEIGFYPIGFYPSRQATIEIETASLEIEANGQLLGLSDIRFQETDSKVSKVQSLDGTLRKTGWSLYIIGRSPISDPRNLVLHIPSILVDGTSIPAQTVSFEREKTVRLRFLIVNC